MVSFQAPELSGFYHHRRPNGSLKEKNSHKFPKMRSPARVYLID
jgi:hypothetical protein